MARGLHETRARGDAGALLRGAAADVGRHGMASFALLGMVSGCGPPDWASASFCFPSLTFMLLHDALQLCLFLHMAVGQNQWDPILG